MTYNMFLVLSVIESSNTEQINKSIRELGHKIDQFSNINRPSASESCSGNMFEAYYQKLGLSTAIVPNFDSVDTDGNPVSIEDNIRKDLLEPRQHHDKIFSILGQGGVGKTIVLHMLSRYEDLRRHFCHSVYHMKLGADAKTDTAIRQLVEIIRRSGGVTEASKHEKVQNVYDVITEVSKWLGQKKYLLLVDDIWERKHQEQFGPNLIIELKTLIAGSDEASIVFTTRDANIASLGEVCQLNARESQREESRCERSTERAVRRALECCGAFRLRIR